MKIRSAIISLLVFAGFAFALSGAAYNICVVDSYDGMPLPAAAVFNRNEVLLGMTDRDGSFALSDSIQMPVIIRFEGYSDAVCLSVTDTVRMNPSIVRQLPEVSVTQDKVGARLVCLANEKMTIIAGNDTTNVMARYLVDYIVPVEGAPKGFKSHHMPRILDKKMDIKMVKNGEKTEPTNVYDDLFWEVMDPVNFVTIGKGKLNYPSKLDDSEYANYDVAKGKSTHHFWRRGNTVSLFVDGLEGQKDRKMSPGILKLLGATLDITRIDITEIYAYNPHGINQSLDLAGKTLAFNVTYRGKWIKKLFKTKDNVSCQAVVKLEPLDYQLITTEESKELTKNPGNLSLSDYANGKRPVLY